MVDHPALRNDDRFDVDLRVWQPEEGRYHYAREGSLGEIQDDFEFPRTNETGTCG